MRRWLRIARFLPTVLTGLLAIGPALAASPAPTPPAPTPPMGWNSWDAYGFTIDEADFKANVGVLATLKRYGWTYAVVDEGWYMADPFGKTLAERQYLLDGNGLLVPVPARFPTAADGRGFKTLADWVHAQGLKFGLHIVRGIPKQAVERNTPVAGASFHAADVADTADTCPWDDGNYGVRDTPAGQAYYDSMMAQYARWGLDFLKVDCIADHPYKASEIRQISSAIAKTGRPIVLSLSPGPTNLSHAAEISRYGQMWRITNDVWDGWTFPHEKPGDDFPYGVRDLFDRLPGWAPHTGQGRWPDADMLPIGTLAPHPGWGEPRASRLTAEEQRTLITLWAIARSPLILGANLTKLDDATRALITNRAVIAVDQTAKDSRPVTDLPAGFENARVWLATGAKGQRYLALFNLDDKPATLSAPWEKVGLAAGRHAPHDLWTDKALPAAEAMAVTLPAHGSALFEVK
ncbi:glycoside hydrolase family 27 protein [Nitrospirillum sp. BR 11752]|uniref:glycoside hydrolase family 27 protein n=1 Tax=Nitrospirillum sp. BR 11752 TaxID=3104293 RepID=UPI002EC0ED31|nr:glycoside hydrolase family 27 protein [Nitrospirillum sp. BR 11752]